jgi:sugar phosphate permease
MMNKTSATNYRWTICSLLFFATTINYLDRQVLSLTWTDWIQPEFHWTNEDYGNIAGVFSLVYAISMLFAGKFIDWMDTKKRFPVGDLHLVFGCMYTCVVRNSHIRPFDRGMVCRIRRCA